METKIKALAMSSLVVAFSTLFATVTATEAGTTAVNIRDIPIGTAVAEGSLTSNGCDTVIPQTFAPVQAHEELVEFTLTHTAECELVLTRRCVGPEACSTGDVDPDRLWRSSGSSDEHTSDAIEPLTHTCGGSAEDHSKYFMEDAINIDLTWVEYWSNHGWNCGSSGGTQFLSQNRNCDHFDDGWSTNSCIFWSDGVVVLLDQEAGGTLGSFDYFGCCSHSLWSDLEVSGSSFLCTYGHTGYTPPFGDLNGHCHRH